ncbi:sigma-E factor negative regulatory protein [Salinicola halophilus]|uniref:sigma-E factor negative regulatory protein n=1 Tax=Salinicola halophilus TaxID=184065 RepID=UPI0013A66CFB|nr:sigma-E factor negative regulatory protein [Salinicola halophilus]
MKQVNESFSALMDNEGDEFDLRRVLKRGEATNADVWRRYHLARSMMRRERDSVVDADISGDVLAALRDEPQVATPEPDATPHKRHSFSMMGGAAVAAAVSLMVITGVQVYNGRFADNGGATDIASTPSNDATPSFVTPNGGTGVREGQNGVVPASMQAPASDGMPFTSMGSGSGFMTIGDSVGGAAYRTSGDANAETSVRPFFERHAMGDALQSDSSGSEDWAPLLRSTGTYASQLHQASAPPMR